jgi:cell division protein FtsQ
MTTERSGGAPPRHRASNGATDPRIRARKIAVYRAAGRRRLQAVCSLIALGALAAGAIAALHSPLLAARRVTIVGALRTPPAEVLSVSGLGRRPPLIDVSAAADESAIDALPWVARATVERQWPDAVRVVVVERHPVAQIALAGGRYALVDPTGRVLAETAGSTSALAPVTGGGAVPPPGGWLDQVQRAAVDAAGALPVSMVKRVASVGTGAAGIVIKLVRGPDVLLGAPSELRDKMVALATVLARVALSGVLTIDLRVPQDPVLTS